METGLILVLFESFCSSAESALSVFVVESVFSFCWLALCEYGPHVLTLCKENYKQYIDILTILLFVCPYVFCVLVLFTLIKFL